MFVLWEEQFKELIEYQGYAIGSKGTFLSNKNKNKEWRKMIPYTGTTSPYLQITICNKGKKKHLQIHRLVAQYFVDGYFEGAVVGHKDANPHNNDYNNLKWMTQKDNIHQSYQDSGVCAVRNYKLYIISTKEGVISPILKGGSKVKLFINNNNLDTSYSSLMKYGRSKDYYLSVI